MEYTILKKTDLVSLCKERNLKRYSAKSKEQLIQLLESNIRPAPASPVSAPTMFQSPSVPIRYIDLFCGLGAFHTSFNTNSRFECVFASDIDVGIQNIYKKNYGINVHGDIRSIDPSKLPEFDILCAGFPCQPFSIAGNGEGFQDTAKGNLFYDILKIVDVKHPSMCILENVKNLKTHDEGTTYRTIETELVKRGYLVSSRVINATEFGSPQARQRIFIVATKDKLFTIPTGSAEIRPVSSILNTYTEHEDISREKYDVIDCGKESTDRSKPRIVANLFDKKTKKGGRQGERVYDPAHVGITICASSGGPGAKTGLYKVGDKIRRLNVLEALGMFGFPSTYDFTDVRPENALFYLGNSIVVDVVKAFVEPICSWFSDR